MRNTKLLLFNTLVLTATGFLMRSISVTFNVYLTNKIGVAGIGLFQLIMTVYSLAVTFSGAGVKLAATRLITDCMVQDRGQMHSAMKACIRYSLTAGCLISAIMYLCSGLISRRWIADENAEISLKLLALSLPPVSLSAALNGYFTARKTISKYAVVQLIEQFVKIVITVMSISVFAARGTAYACGAISGGITAAELISCLLSYYLYRRDREAKTASAKKGNMCKKLFTIALPDAIGSGVRSVLLTVEHLLIPKGFKKSGQNSEEALSVYGNIHGMALPIVLYPATVLTSLSGLLVPEFAAYRANGKSEKIDFLACLCLRFTFMFSMGICTFMFAFSLPLSLSIYHSDSTADYIKLLSLLIPVMYMDTVVDGILKGLDQQLASMRYNIFDSALCVVLVYTILPVYAVKGYIFILFFSEIINFSLSINRLAKISSLQINPWRDLIKPILGASGTGAVINILMTVFGIERSTKGGLIIAAVAFTFIYTAALYGLNCINRSDLKFFKQAIGNRA